MHWRNKYMYSFIDFLLEKTMFKSLSGPELMKPGREGRADTVIKKISGKDPFLLMNGKTVIIKNDDAIQQFVDAKNAGNSRELSKIVFTGTDGKKYNLKDFAKSPEFGGKGAGSGTRAEDEALADLKKKFYSVLDKETVPFIYIKIGKKTEKVMSIESTPGTPKSDFHFMDETGKEVFWISHKKGSKANDFQQYGGMPELKFTASKDMLNFVDSVKKELDGAKRFPMKTAYARKVLDPSLVLMSLYGKEFKRGKADTRQNIDVLYQGMMNFKRQGMKDGIPVYTITSNHTQLHGERPKGDYECYYYVRPEQAKNQFGIPGARFFIVAKLTALKNRNTKVL